MKLLIACLFISMMLIAGGALPAQSMELASGGKARCTIVCSEYASPAEAYAAQELADYLQQITGATFPVRTDSEPVDGPRIIVGPCMTSRAVLGPRAVNNLEDDEFIIRTMSGDLLLVGGRPRGTLNAVYHFLDNVLGVRWWTPDAAFVPQERELTTKPFNIRSKPVFAYRSVFQKPALDQDWAARNRLNGLVLKGEGHAGLAEMDATHGGTLLLYPKGSPGWHTFDLYVPARLVEEHPEWFSLFDGRRVGGQHSGQLCLTNPELLDYMVEQVRKDLSRYPRANIVSISHNDNPCYCRCDACAKVDEEEGSQSGTMIRFVNSCAERLENEFPDVRFHTFAYTYTRKPPKITKPRHNVLVQLCSVECSFGVPFDHPLNSEFLDDLKGWAAITDRLHVWDYTANFAILQRPHPNLRALAPNLRILASNKARYVFSQGIWQSHCELQELRSWVLSRLLWDPEQDDRALILEFIDGYYGKAGPLILEYIDMIHDCMEGSDYSLIFGDQGDAPFLTAETMSKAEVLFQEAEAVVAEEPETLRRVKAAHLAVQQMWLAYYDEWAKVATEKGYLEPMSALELLDLFEREAKAAGASHISDGMAMGIFINNMRQKFTSAPTAWASSQWGLAEPYLAFDGNIDTIWLAPGFGPEWIVKDLQQPTIIESVRTSFSENERYIRTSYTLEGSLDGENWFIIVPERAVKGGLSEDTLDSPVETRYVRTTILETISVTQPEWVSVSEQTFGIVEP